MPVGKISRSGNSFTGAAEYDLAQGKHRRENKFKKPKIIDSNFIFGDYFKDIGREFRAVAFGNKKCKKPVMKFSISFDPNEEISDENKLEFTHQVMKEMGITDEHQFMITRHSDKAHDHHHILANRVGLDAIVISDSYTINRLETAMDKIEKKMGLKNFLAQRRRYVYDESNEKGYATQLQNFGNRREKVVVKNTRKGVQNNKSYIQNEVENALRISRNFNDFYIFLMMKKIEAQLRFNEKNILTGASFSYKKFKVKGSALGTNFKASNLQKKIEENALKIDIEETYKEISRGDSGGLLR